MFSAGSSLMNNFIFLFFFKEVGQGAEGVQNRARNDDVRTRLRGRSPPYPRDLSRIRARGRSHDGETLARPYYPFGRLQQDL